MTSTSEIYSVLQTVDTVIDLLNFALLDSVRASRGSFGFEILNTLGKLTEGALDILGLTSRLSSNSAYWSEANGYVDLFQGTTFKTLGDAVDALDARFFYDMSAVFDHVDLRLLDRVSEVFSPVDLGFLNGLVDVLNRLDFDALQRGTYGNDLLGDLATVITNVDDLQALSQFIHERLIQGSQTNDRLVGLGQTDLVLGLSGDDTLLGRAGSDLLNGGSGGDRLKGMGGADVLVGDHHSDRLNGGSGADILIGGAGVDWLWGGGGADVFVFEMGPSPDRVIDFAVGKDRLQINLDDLLRDPVSLINRADGALVMVGQKRLALLEGVNAADLSVADIVIQTPQAYG